ncbi:hypothetical protein K438DRAFT_1971287 [Mycena galopus ATCC 62051]|nr:hypothetical protein K438DRAFT_1971287 [Mycena galopus ATCC 62051]
MPITILESHWQHRNSGVRLETVLCNLPHLPPPPYSQTAPPLNGGDNLKVSRSRWEGPKTTKKRPRSKEAADLTFLNIRHAVFTPPPFTRNSRFPSRTLPPLGVRGCNLDATDAKVFKVGDSVRVRRLNIDGEKSSWSSGWQCGKVLSYVPMRGYIGNFGHAYCVDVVQSGQHIIQTYVQFLGEICPDDGLDHEEDSLTAEECRKRRQKANYIYTRIPSDTTIFGIPHQDIWTPAEILSWAKGGHIHVRPLAGPTAGKKMIVQDALPYTLETAVACRKIGDSVFGPSGKLFLADISVKPLEMADDPATVSSFSPSALTASWQ